MSTHTKPILGYPEYLAGDDGKIYSLTGWRGSKMRPLTPVDNRDGYLKVRIHLGDGKRKNIPVNKLIALAFLPPKPSVDHETRHLDGNSHNNKPDNLTWGTRKENAADRANHGRTSHGLKHGVAISDGIEEAKRTRLIAAAPELLAAATAYFAAVDGSSNLEAEAKAEKQLRAAIVKAEGRA